MRRPLALILCSAITAGWLWAIVSAVHLRAADSSSYLSNAIYAAASLICHQRPERSFHIAGVPLAVCARCTGLYSGAAMGVLMLIAFSGLGRISPARVERAITPQRAKRALITLGAPTIVTVVTALLGWWDPGNTIRATLAVPLGAIAGAVVAAVAAGDLR
jgi:uncharacterized membrane protein